MKTLDWINNEIVANNLICAEIDKIRQAKSKKQLFEVCCGAKGIDFLPMMMAKGHALPYSVIIEEFGRYLNGAYKPEIDGYTSAIYCQYNEDFTIDTTATCFMGCECDVYIHPNDFVKLVIDENCALRVFCHDTARLIIECWGDETTFEIVEGKDRVRLIKMPND